MTRPFGVTIVAILVLLSGVLDVVLGVMMLLSPFYDSPTLTDLDGTAISVPTYYLVVNGLLSVVLGLMYFWLTRMTLIGSNTAYVLINMLAGINIFFALFRLPYGWGIIGLSALALVIVNTDRSRRWFRQAV